VEKEKIDQFRLQLERLALEIEDYLRKSKASAEAVEPDKGLGRLSRMEAMQDQQMVLELRRRKKRQRLEVSDALDRIADGTFGSCVFCGNKISLDRLEAFPEAQVCVTCA